MSAAPALNGAHVQPGAPDRVAAAAILARLGAVADKPDHVIRETLATCLMELREANSVGARSAIEQLRLGLEIAHRVMLKAGALMSFLRANAGETADWPVRLTADNPATAQQFARLLIELETSLGKRPPPPAKPE
jgi:hypothetical protein